MKIRLSIIAAGCIVLSACGGASDETESVAPDDTTPLKQEASFTVGAVFSQTGDFSIYSPSVINALDLAFDELAALGPPSLTLELQDDASDVNQSVAVYERYLRDDAVIAIMGPLVTPAVLAAAPLAQAAETPVILSTISSEAATAVGDYIFRTSVSTVKLVPKLMEVAARDGIDTIAIMQAVDDDYAIGDAEAATESAQSSGIDVVAHETYATGDVDFRTQLTKIRDADPDAIHLSAQAEESLTIIRQAREIFGDDIRFTGGNQIMTGGMLEEGGSELDGILSVSTWLPQSERAESSKFVDAYRAAFDTEPDNLAAQTYDAVMIIHRAVSRTFDEGKLGGDIAAARQALRTAIAETEYVGVLGEITFDEAGDPSVDGTPIVIRDGEVHLFDAE